MSQLITGKCRLGSFCEHVGQSLEKRRANERFAGAAEAEVRGIRLRTEMAFPHHAFPTRLMLLLLLFVYLFETGSLCVALAVLELSL